MIVRLGRSNNVGLQKGCIRARVGLCLNPFMLCSASKGKKQGLEPHGHLAAANWGRQWGKLGRGFSTAESEQPSTSPASAGLPLPGQVTRTRDWPSAIRCKRWHMQCHWVALCSEGQPKSLHGLLANQDEERIHRTVSYDTSWNTRLCFIAFCHNARIGISIKCFSKAILLNAHTAGLQSEAYCWRVHVQDWPGHTALVADCFCQALYSAMPLCSVSNTFPLVLYLPAAFSSMICFCNGCLRSKQFVHSYCKKKVHFTSMIIIHGIHWKAVQELYLHQMQVYYCNVLVSISIFFF